MSPNADSLGLLFANERDKLMKAFETRLSEFELRIQLLLEKQPKRGCLKQENRILESVSNLEMEFGKISQRMQSNDVMQKKLLKQLEILNESELLKQSRSNSHDLSNSNFGLRVDEIYSKQSGVAEEYTEATSPVYQNMDSRGTIKNEVSEEVDVDDDGCVTQNSHQPNGFENVYMSPMITLPLQEEEIAFGYHELNKNNNESIEGDESFTDMVNAQAYLQEMLSHNEADTNDPHGSCNDAPLSINEPHALILKNPHLCLRKINDKITNQDVCSEDRSWTKEISYYSKPSSPGNYNKISENNEILLLSDVVTKQEHGIEDEQGSINQSFNVCYQNDKITQPVNSQQLLSGNEHECEKCDRIFADEGSLKRHMKMKHFFSTVTERHKCKLCSYSSNCKGHLKSHLRIHTKEKPYQCAVCSKKFSQKGNLNKHRRIHTEEFPYKCSKCGKKFSDSGYFQTHLSTAHDTNKPFACEVCGCRFALINSLKRHMFIHTGVRNYKCQYCDRKFSESGNLRAHERIHTGERPYKCKECSAAFSNSSCMRYHVITQHTKKYPYRCSACEKGFVVLSHMKDHEKKFHKKMAQL